MEVIGPLRALPTLLPEKNPHYPLNKKMGRAQGWSGQFGEEKKSLSPTGIGTSQHSSHILVTTPTMLSHKSRISICNWSLYCKDILWVNTCQNNIFLFIWTSHNQGAQSYSLQMQWAPILISVVPSPRGSEPTFLDRLAQGAPVLSI